jgi:hypothetical protein
MATGFSRPPPERSTCLARPLNQIVVGQLEEEADVGSQELLDRLIALDPERYGPQHKRTLQRRIRDWRVARVQECMESAAQRPETMTETREKVLPGVNQNG